MTTLADFALAFVFGFRDLLFSDVAFFEAFLVVPLRVDLGLAEELLDLDMTSGETFRLLFRFALATLADDLSVLLVDNFTGTLLLFEAEVDRERGALMACVVLAILPLCLPFRVVTVLLFEVATGRLFFLPFFELLREDIT